MKLPKVIHFCLFILATLLPSQGVYAKVKCEFLHGNSLLNQILDWLEKSKRRNELFLFVDKQEWLNGEQSKTFNLIKRKISCSQIPSEV
jgi:hypothetical protein